MREIFLVWAFEQWEFRKEILMKSYDRYPAEEELAVHMRDSKMAYLRVEKIYGVPVMVGHAA